MGYCISQEDAKFRIKYGQQPAALAAIKGLIGSGKETCKDRWSGKSYFAWVDSERLVEASQIEDALSEWGWQALFEPETNDIDRIEFEAEKLGDEAVLFEAIAPFVEAGSFIEMLGEDGDRWRWTFDGQTCREIHATVTWDGPA